MAQWLVRLTPDLRSPNGLYSISRQGYRLGYERFIQGASLHPGVKVCAGKILA